MTALPNLTKKFNSKVNVTLIFAVSAAILQVISILGCVFDSNKRTKELEDFEKGSGAPPASSTAHAELVFGIIQVVALIGFGLAIFTLMENPNHMLK